MAQLFRQIIHDLTPNLGPVSGTERLRASLGALLGILLTAVITRLLVGASADVPLLVAPMGASAVLLFAAPSSPLGQPWSILGGNVSAALVGITCRIWIPDPFLAAAAAVCLAIGVMFALRCLHPPGGAVAVVAALATPAVEQAGYGFALAPVGLNSLLLLMVALAYNNVTGRAYPHPRPVERPSQTGRADSPPSARMGFMLDDLDAVLRRHDEVIDVDRDYLADILRETEMHAYRRRSGDLTCADIMSRDVASVAPADSLDQAWKLMRRHRIKALPVTAEGRLIGIVTQTDFMDMIGAGPGIVARLPGQRLKRVLQHGLSSGIEVRSVMSSPVRAARPETTIAELVPLMADAGVHHLPVVDGEGRLAGIVTQSDLIAALFSGARFGLQVCGKAA